jgi:hypothetical protein
MCNIEKVANGWIIRGRDKNGMPISYVARTREELFDILENKLQL